MNIENNEVYLSRMSAAIADKLFFFDYLPENMNIFLDYGCADGTLLRKAHERYPQAICIGYDTNEDFIKKASADCPSNCYFYSSLEQVKYILDSAYHARRGPVALILSSVVHEVFTYENYNGIQTFWNFIGHPMFDYLCIRDMGLAQGEWHRAANKTIVSKVREWACTSARQHQIGDFVEKRGDLTNQYNLCEFLLKYAYTENWDREVEENYFALSPETLMKELFTRSWSPIYFRHWTLPYIQNKIKDDFGIDMPCNTHYKGVWKRA